MTPLYLLPLLMLLQQTPPTTPAQVQAPASNTKPGTIRGHVYASDTGLGVKHADVSLRPTGRFQPQEVSTDTQGGFQFLNVDPGQYTLSCNKSGFVGSSYGAKNANTPPTTFKLSDSQDLKDIDCRMAKGGAITGIVTNDEGDPVVYANVQVMQKTYRRGQVQLQAKASGTTDDRGRYRIFDLSPGRYYVQATRRGAGPSATREAAYAAVIYPSAARLQDAQAMTLAAGGEVSGIDMVLRTVQTFSVSGKVIDLVAGHALVGGNINAMPDDFFMGGGGGGFGGGQIKQDGTFLLKGLTPGHYRLQVAGFGGGGGGGRGGPGGPGGPGGGQVGGGPRMFSKAIDIGTQNVTDLVISIGPGATIKGKVEAEGGALPDNMRVNMSQRGDGSAGFRGPGGTASAQIAADGTFEIPDVQTGSYDLVFNTRGGPQGGQGGLFVAGNAQTSTSGFFLSAVLSGGQDVLDSGIVVPEGASMMQVAATIDFRSSTITGRALNEDGDPMAGVPVVLVSSDPKKRTIDRYFKTTFADSNGNYSLSSVIPGSYLMVLWPEADPYTVQDPDVMEQLEKQAVRVSVERASSATQDLKMTSQIRVIAQTFAQ
jgi:hypothetical protein